MTLLWRNLRNPAVCVTLSPSTSPPDLRFNTSPKMPPPALTEIEKWHRDRTTDVSEYTQMEEMWSHFLSAPSELEVASLKCVHGTILKRGGGNSTFGSKDLR